MLEGDGGSVKESVDKERPFYVAQIMIKKKLSIAEMIKK